ncbi:Rieske (2Fe-2S) protein [Candidatus Nitrosotenuis uzonensis]|nr:non-heme iron oxygenase ferredoxin subunit [Candidatus Nitrosotenuis uzonensis]
MARWIRACTMGQVGKNEMYSFDFEDKRLLITNLGGKIFASDRICTHEEADLSTGFLSSEGVRCPLHLSVFNLENGIPQNPPAERPLKIYNVKIDQNEIYVEV